MSGTDPTPAEFTVVGANMVLTGLDVTGAALTIPIVPAVGTVEKV